MSEERGNEGEMFVELPSPPLSRMGSTTLPLCSQPLYPGPQPFWREGKVAAFSLPLPLRGIASERLRLLCCSSSEDTLQLALLEIICFQGEKILTRNNLLASRLFFFTFFF